ncbi:MAG: DUF421 domain-containing protein [Anaerolineae bacterium]|nr:MAG: DUF421 domain-containing protein [Anaerolineae bacterium]
MFNLDLASALEIVARSLAVYFVVLVGLRLGGKRAIGQMTVFDLVVLLLIANAVQNAMVGPDTSLLGGILAAVVLLVVNALVARLRMSSPRLRRLVEGSPTLLVLHGEVIPEHMSREEIDEESLMEALREHGVAELSGVEMAVLEIDGSISVIPAGGTTTRVKKPRKLLRH